LFKKKKILALVPARSGSKGIKYKNIIKINKKPLINYTLDFINKLKFIDLKVVSSNSKKILSMAKNKNFIPLERTASLSGDRISDFQVIKSVLLNPNVKKKNCDYLIYLQPTSPKRKKKDLISALNKVIKDKLFSAWTVSKIDIKNHPLKVFFINKKYLRLYDNNGKKIIARQQLNNVYIRNGVFYIFSIKHLLKNKSIYLNKTLPVIIDYKAINIDNPKDLIEAKMIL
jgi:CMP-N,N'-diacetyllegionaminic acid synthase